MSVSARDSCLVVNSNLPLVHRRYVADWALQLGLAPCHFHTLLSSRLLLNAFDEFFGSVGALDELSFLVQHALHVVAFDSGEQAVLQTALDRVNVDLFGALSVDRLAPEDCLVSTAACPVRVTFDHCGAFLFILPLEVSIQRYLVRMK